MINLIFENDKKDNEEGLVDNARVSANLANLHKRVFVKCAVEDDFKINKRSLGQIAGIKSKSKKMSSVGSLPT